MTSRLRDVYNQWVYGELPIMLELCITIPVALLLGVGLFYGFDAMFSWLVHL